MVEDQDDGAHPRGDRRAHRRHRKDVPRARGRGACRTDRGAHRACPDAREQASRPRWPTFFERLLGRGRSPRASPRWPRRFPSLRRWTDEDVATAEWTAPVQTSVEVEPAPQPVDAWGTAQYERQAHTDAPGRRHGRGRCERLGESRAPFPPRRVSTPLVAEEPVARSPQSPKLPSAEAPVAEMRPSEAGRPTPYSSGQPEPAGDVRPMTRRPRSSPRTRPPRSRRRTTRVVFLSLQAEASAAAEASQAEGADSRASGGARVGQRSSPAPRPRLPRIRRAGTDHG